MNTFVQMIPRKWYAMFFSAQMIEVILKRGTTPQFAVATLDGEIRGLGDPERKHQRHIPFTSLPSEAIMVRENQEGGKVASFKASDKDSGAFGQVRVVKFTTSARFFILQT